VKLSTALSTAFFFYIVSGFHKDKYLNKVTYE
jgi:hypothetical protein